MSSISAYLSQINPLRPTLPLSASNISPGTGKVRQAALGAQQNTIRAFAIAGGIVAGIVLFPLSIALLTYFVVDAIRTPQKVAGDTHNAPLSLLEQLNAHPCIQKTPDAKVKSKSELKQEYNNKPHIMKPPKSAIENELTMHVHDLMMILDNSDVSQKDTEHFAENWLSHITISNSSNAAYLMEQKRHTKLSAAIISSAPDSFVSTVLRAYGGRMENDGRVVYNYKNTIAALIKKEAPKENVIAFHNAYSQFHTDENETNNRAYMDRLYTDLEKKTR